MVPLTLNAKGRYTVQILCLGAHSDDIEIGCGGTILRLLADSRHLEFYWVVLSSTVEREREARKSAQLFLKGARRKTVVVKRFRNGFFPAVGGKVKEYFEELKGKISPDLIFTHYRHDLHQDHRVVSDLTWNTFRNHLILEYEIPKYDGDLGSPNCFVPLDKVIYQAKTRNLLSSFRSQRDKDWFSEDTFLSLMRLRGVESHAPSKYAEAFYSRKFLLT
jgi:LmbE family N-acetylglucosaminyl deacetylase